LVAPEGKFIKMAWTSATSRKVATGGGEKKRKNIVYDGTGKTPENLTLGERRTCTAANPLY